MTELVGQMDNSLTDLSALSHSNKPHSTKVTGEQVALTSPRLTRDQLIKDQQADQAAGGGGWSSIATRR